MTQPQNPLETALAHAATEPAARPDFYRLLLETEVYVIGQSEAADDGSKTLAAGTTFSLVNFSKDDGTPFIPFFASMDALQRVLSEEARYMAMSARDLFENTRGANLVLNPGSSHVKEFLANEIEALLATGVNHVAETRVVEEDTQVLLGEPADYPAAMVASLTTLLARREQVKAAYMCLMHDPGSGRPPSLVVGLEGRGELAQAMREAGTVAADTALDGIAVDFVEITPGTGGLSDHFLASVKPFYERSWGTRLRSMLSSGRA